MTYTPAQTKRSNFTAHVSNLAKSAKTADDFVQVASEMLDGRSAGRTERWQGACTMAARRILLAAKDGPVTNTLAEDRVGTGVLAMMAAIK